MVVCFESGILPPKSFQGCLECDSTNQQPFYFGLGWWGGGGGGHDSCTRCGELVVIEVKSTGEV